jgi:3-oxoacyl-[acyl-carrier protein] reductase
VTGGHVLVTGAARGIGRAIAARFGADGWQVSGVDMRIDELAAAMAELPEGRGLGYRADLADPAAPETIIRSVWLRQPIDHLVNAAGIYPARRFLDLDARLWDRVQAVNVRAPCCYLVRSRPRRSAPDVPAAS